MDPDQDAKAGGRRKEIIRRRWLGRCGRNMGLSFAGRWSRSFGSNALGSNYGHVLCMGFEDYDSDQLKAWMPIPEYKEVENE